MAAFTAAFAQSPRRSSFVPRLDTLEDRDCPSCTLTFQDGLLSIVGDRGANEIAIVNTWAGTQITYDQGDPRIFVGVRAISLRTGDGADRVTFVARGLQRTLPTLTADLGGGADTFVADLDVPPGPCQARVDGGAGDDDLQASFTVAPVESALPAVQINLDLAGAAGADRMRAIFNFLPAVQDSALPAVQLPAVQFHLDGGLGNDAIRVDAAGAQPGLLAGVILGGNGNDTLTADTNFLPAVQSGDLPAVQLNLDIEGAAGNDAIGVTKHGSTMQHSKVHLGGGGGNDSISLLAAASANSIASALTTFETEEMDGGDGDDTLTFFALPPDDGSQLALGYTYSLVMHGGGGDDTLIAVARYAAPAHPGDTGSISEFGDDGDDQHVLLYSGPFTTLLADGGSGFDTGLSPSSHTPNVTVLNCEI